MVINMGVDLDIIIPKKTITLDELSGKSLAIDAYNTLYQFLAIIRQPDGTPLKDRQGRITSHLSGILYRTSNLYEKGAKVVYVFDGEPPELKEAEIKRRMRIKEEATIKYEEALKRKEIEKARMYAQMTSRLKDEMVNDAKRLLTLMGVPWVQAPSEGEAQASYMAAKGDVWAVVSQDHDSLLFGAPQLVRNVTISGRRKLPRKKVYIEVVPEIVELDRALNELGITHEQLIDIGILVGTDFNPEGVKGIGPKTALKLVKEHGSLEKLLPTLKEAEFPVEPQRIREIFLHPKVTDNYRIAWREPNAEGIVGFLCRERDFSEERVQKALEKMTEGVRKVKGKLTLEAWFGHSAS
ncbi:MAG: Flap endonuclease 1 [Candidatus Bathyarchaeota archaeon BA1]|nr:MAG: Flap endonuclease 1 [Candidatus Bathyarchaeota archaeon BA1]